MTVTTTPEAPSLELSAELLVAEIERYLAARATGTAHPLVTKTTAELVAEALAAPAPAEVPTPAFGPLRLFRLLPDWMLPLLRQLHGGYGRTLSPAEHLELTALVIERYGWTQGQHRSRSGRRCILGAQAVLYRLGYGDDATVTAAAAHLQAVLTERGIHQPYHQWNDDPDRTREQVLALVREAAQLAARLDTAA